MDNNSDSSTTEAATAAAEAETTILQQRFMDKLWRIWQLHLSAKSDN